MYFVDSGTPYISAFDYDPSDGSISNRRPAFDLSAHGYEVSYADLKLLLDGMTVDKEGNIYVAYAGSGKVK